MIQQQLPANLTPRGFQQITDLSSAVTLTVPAGARLALIQADTQDLRWRDDGTSPTATVGMLLPADTTPLLFQGSLADIEFIETAASAVLNVSYYG